MFIKSLFAAALAAIGFSAFGFDQPAYDATYTTNGITYAQRGGLGVKDFVVTNIDASAVGKVKSVNGRVGDVVLDAAAVNALPDDKDELVSNDNFKEAVVTNALTVATTNRVAALETAMDEKANSADIPGMVKETMSADGISSSYINIGGSISGQTVGDQYGDLRAAINGKADKTIPSANGNLAALTADGNLADSGKNASDFLPASSSFAGIWDIWDSTTFRGDLSVGPNGDILGVSYDHGSLYKFGDTRWYYGEETSDANEIAVKGDISAALSATNPTLSNAVLAVALNIDTNSVAVLNEIADTFGGFPIEGTATTVGGLLAALAAAAAWLKKNKVGSFASVGGATATVDNGVAKLDDFFTESNSLLTSRVNTLMDAKVGEVNAVLAAAHDGTQVA